MLLMMKQRMTPKRIAKKVPKPILMKGSTLLATSLSIS